MYKHIYTHIYIQKHMQKIDMCVEICTCIHKCVYICTYKHCNRVLYKNRIDKMNLYKDLYVSMWLKEPQLQVWSKNPVVVQYMRLDVSVFSIGQNPKDLGSGASEGMELPLRVMVNRKRANASFFHVFIQAASKRCDPT